METKRELQKENEELKKLITKLCSKINKLKRKKKGEVIRKKARKALSNLRSRLT